MSCVAGDPMLAPLWGYTGSSEKAAGTSALHAFQIVRQAYLKSKAGQQTWLVAEVAVLRQNFSSKKLQFLFLRPSTAWMTSIHIMEGNLLSLQSTDYRR